MMPAMQRQITPNRILQRAKGLLTSAGKPTLALQDALGIAVGDESPQAGTILHTKSLDDGKGTLGNSVKRSRGFLNAKVKSISFRSKSQDLHSRPPVTNAPYASSSLEEQPTTLIVPVASSSMQHVAEKSSMADVTVPLLLREGVQMTKVSPGKEKSYKFQLDPDQGQIIWQSKKLRISTYLHYAKLSSAGVNTLYH
jgi:phosphatidylinositol phospholipase C delta